MREEDTRWLSRLSPAARSIGRDGPKPAKTASATRLVNRSGRRTSRRQSASPRSGCGSAWRRGTMVPKQASLSRTPSMRSLRRSTKSAHRRATRHMHQQKCDRLLGRWHAKAGARRVKHPASLPRHVGRADARNRRRLLQGARKRIARALIPRVHRAARATVAAKARRAIVGSTPRARPCTRNGWRSRACSRAPLDVASFRPQSIAAR